MTHSNGTPWSSEPPLKPTHWATIAFQRHVLELARESNVVVKTDGAEFDKVDLAIKLLWQQQGYAEGMRAFLLAPTREAVVGIAARLELELGLACSAFYGSRVEFWDKDDWGCALRDTTVLVCTPEAARQAVEKEYVSTQHINLLILEDCHLAKKRHPYAQLVRLCSKHDEATTPRIIGMSAHPTQTCVDVLHATLAEMASHADSPAAAVAPIVYERYEKQDAFANSPDPAARTGPTEASASVEVGVDETLAIESLVAGLKQGDAPALGRAGQFSSDSGRRGEEFVRACANIHARLGLWCFYRFVELKLEKQLMFPSHHQPPVLNVDPGSTLQWLRDQRGQCDFAATSRLARVEELIVTKLLLVEDYGSSQAIVFVRTRAECRVISEYLNEKVFAPLGILGFSGCILGRASRLDTASVGLPHFQQTMSDFAFGLSRVLVATTVSAEGLHLPLCRAVIVADEVDAPLVLGQMQQQAEPTCGSVHYLAEDGDFRNWVRFQRLLDGTKPSGRSDVPNGAPRSTATPAPPSQAPVDRELRGCLRRQQGAEATSDSRGVALPRVLDLQSSVQCVSEFCQSLPAKRISTNGAKLFELVERWCDTSKAPSFKATLQLPPVPRLYPDQMADLFASPFEGEFERSKAAAKASAALLACKRLLEYGYLRASLKSVFCKEKALLCNDAESKPAVLMHACVSV